MACCSPLLCRRLVFAPSICRHIAHRAFSTPAQIIPVVDFSPFLEGTEEGKRKVASEIGFACEEIGFLVLKNHGVNDQVIDSMWQQTRAFFDLPLEHKLKGLEMTADYPYGYSPLGGETLSKGKDKEKGEINVAFPDLKEMFSIGPYNPKSGSPPQRYPEYPVGFRAAQLAYYKVNPS